MNRERPSLGKATAAAHITATVIALLIALLLVACGGTTTSATPTPQPTPNPTPTPPPTPTPTPTPSNSPDSYLAQFVNDIPKVPDFVGHVTIDTAANDGTGKVTLTGGMTNQAMVLQFCPFPQREMNCINVTSFTTDTNGLANVNFTFPQKGAFSGMFQLMCDGAQCLVTGSGSTGVNFKSAELPAASITGGLNQPVGNPPGIGAMVVNGTMAHLTLTATTPNHTFSVAICPMFPETPCQPMSNVTADANGNVSADVGNVQPAGWNVFTVSDSAGVEFVSGFRVQ